MENGKVTGTICDGLLQCNQHLAKWYLATKPVQKKCFSNWLNVMYEEVDDDSQV